MKKVIHVFAILAMVLQVTHLQAQDLENLLGGMINPGAKASYETEYVFDTYVQLEINDPGNQSTSYESYMTRNGDHFLIGFVAGGEKTSVVVDTRKNAILLLSESSKEGMAMAINPDALADLLNDMQEGINQKAQTMARTGRSKDILGYRCDEYILDDKGTHMQAWVSEQLGRELEQNLLSKQQIFGEAFIHLAGVNGMVMEYQSTDAKGRINSLKVTRLDLNASHSLKTSDYAIMSMGQ